MKTIGLIGGMSWESSIEYYRIINQVIHEQLGGFHSAKSLMASVDFAEIESLMRLGDWDEIQTILVSAAKTLEHGGAAFILLCANSMHKLADAIQANIEIPLLHIADATGVLIQSMGLKTVGLLGTRITMEDDFYRARLTDKFGLQVLIPDATRRQRVHKIIFDELVFGQCLPASRDAYLEIMQDLIERGAQGIVLGCTEIGSLIKQEDIDNPLFDTTLIHATAAVHLALADK